MECREREEGTVVSYVRVCMRDFEVWKVFGFRQKRTTKRNKFIFVVLISLFLRDLEENTAKFSVLCAAACHTHTKHRLRGTKGIKNIA